jgi:hypothetical protein
VGNHLPSFANGHILELRLSGVMVLYDVVASRGCDLIPSRGSTAYEHLKCNGEQHGYVHVQDPLVTSVVRS